MDTTLRCRSFIAAQRVCQIVPESIRPESTPNLLQTEPDQLSQIPFYQVLSVALTRLRILEELEQWRVFMGRYYASLKGRVVKGPHECLLHEKNAAFPHTIRGYVDAKSGVITLSILVGKIGGECHFKVIKRGLEIKDGSINLIAIARPNFKKLRKMQEIGIYPDDFGGLQKDYVVSSFFEERRSEGIILMRRVSYLSKRGELRFKNVMPLCEENMFEKVIFSFAPKGSSVVESKKELLRSCRFVALGLANMHAHDMVHLDINLENLLCCGSEGFICDFGNAVSRNTMVSYAASPGYIPPEFLSCLIDVDAVGVKPSWSMDVWSFGVVLYSVLTGEVPFHDIQTSFLKNKSERAVIFPLFMQKLIKIYGEFLQKRTFLENLIAQCLHPEPQERPTAAIIAERLGLCLASYGPV